MIPRLVEELKANPAIERDDHKNSIYWVMMNEPSQNRAIEIIDYLLNHGVKLNESFIKDAWNYRDKFKVINHLIKRGTDLDLLIEAGPALGSVEDHNTLFDLVLVEALQGEHKNQETVDFLSDPKNIDQMVQHAIDNNPLILQHLKANHREFYLKFQGDGEGKIKC